MILLKIILQALFSGLRSREALILENTALRHQIEVLQRKSTRPALRWRDRAFWDLLSCLWPDWLDSLYIVQPDTVVGWHRRGFRYFWRWKSRPKWPLLRDRDGIYGSDFAHRVASMGIEQIRTAERSPWQNPYVERVIGSIRRECLDYVIIFNERHLRRVLRDFLDYYHRSRTHLGLEKDCPEPRAVDPQQIGPVTSEPVLGGLHHRYFRQAA